MKMDLPEMENPDLNVSSLIDMVFLLLVYFISTCTLVRSEGDLGIKLPGMLAQAEAVDMPDEQIIEIQESGAVFLNGREFDRAARTDKEQHELPELASTLVKYRLACTAAKTEAMVTISAADEVKHQRVIDVMNTCAMAGIKNVTFGAVTE